MLNLRLRSIILATSLVVLGACSSTSSRSSDSAASTSSSSDTTTTSVAPATATTVAAAATTVAAPTTVAATTPATAAPTTKPPTTNAPATAPPATAAPGPKIESFSMVPSASCGVPPAPDVSFTPPATNPPTLKITWVATGADSVYVAVDNKDGIYEQGLPLTGTYEFTLNCGSSHTYWVVAVKGSMKDYKSTTFS